MLRTETCPTQLQHQHVTFTFPCSKVAQESGLNADTTWGLLTHSSSIGATLENVMAAVEDVYIERKQLAHALAHNQTIVQAWPAPHAS